MIDTFSYPKERIWPGMKEFQGASLLVYNDRIFSKSDFNAICNIGNSEKFKDPTKIGQFGVGFNSCYHITDVPSFISDNYLVTLDPMTCYVPHATRGQPGVRIDYIQQKDIITQFPDQVSKNSKFFT
jgi:sacsin